MRARHNNVVDAYECPRCTCTLGDRYPKSCPNCQQRVIYPWQSEKLVEYADSDILDAMIQKMDTTPCPELTFDVNEHMNLYNWLKELRDYRAIGTLAQLME